VVLRQWDKEIQAFSVERTDDPFAEAVSLGASRWRFECTQSHVCNGSVELGRKNAIAVMDEKTVAMVRGDGASPQHGLFRAMAGISARRSVGIRGRPGRDFQRQNRRKPARCQPMKVLGVTLISAQFHGKPCDSSTNINRVTLSKRRGLILRSW